MESNKMKVSTVWENDFVFSMTNPDGNQLKMDAHMEAGGQKKGILPMQALLGSLAGCIGMDFKAILKPHMDTVKSIEIVTEGTKRETRPKDFTAITIRFILTGDVPSEKVWRAIRISAEKYCPVVHSLKPEITYQLLLNGKDIPEQ